jgi:hypothetical protein
MPLKISKATGTSIGHKIISINLNLNYVKTYYRVLVYLAHIAGHFSDHSMASGSEALATIKFPVSRGPPLSNQCTADNIRFLLAMFNHCAATL